MEKRWIIFCFIAQWPGSFGVSFFVWCRLGDPGCVLDHVAGWRNWFSKHSSAVRNLVPSCVMWSLWRERNNRTFEDLEHLVGQLIEFCMSSLFDWSRA